MPVVLAGGLLAAYPAYRLRLTAALTARGLLPDPVVLVRDPVEGAVRLALAAVAPLAR